MGKGDKKTRRGKISQGSYGVLRPRKEPGYIAAVQAVEKNSPELPVAEVETKIIEMPVAEVHPVVSEIKKKAPIRKAAKPAEGLAAEKPKRAKKESE